MSVLNAILNFLANTSLNFGELVLAPFKELNILWIILPIYVTWIVTERYQELKKTSFGNAITNGAVTLWVSVDWSRVIVNSILEGTYTFGLQIFLKIFLCLIAAGYGITIIILGIKLNPIVHVIGRIRQVTYVMLLFTPIIYGIYDLTFYKFMAILFFIIPFYYLVELINKLVPKPSTYAAEDKEDGNGSSDLDFGSSNNLDSKDPFATKDNDPFKTSTNDPFSMQNNDPFRQNTNNNPAPQFNPNNINPMNNVLNFNNNNNNNSQPNYNQNQQINNLNNQSSNYNNNQFNRQNNLQNQNMNNSQQGNMKYNNFNVNSFNNNSNNNNNNIQKPIMPDLTTPFDNNTLLDKNQKTKKKSIFDNLPDFLQH